MGSGVSKKKKFKLSVQSNSHQITQTGKYKVSMDIVQETKSVNEKGNIPNMKGKGTNSCVDNGLAPEVSSESDGKVGMDRLPGNTGGHGGEQSDASHGQSMSKSKLEDTHNISPDDKKTNRNAHHDAEKISSEEHEDTEKVGSDKYTEVKHKYTEENSSNNNTQEQHEDTENIGSDNNLEEQHDGTENIGSDKNTEEQHKDTEKICSDNNTESKHEDTEKSGSDNNTEAKHEDTEKSGSDNNIKEQHEDTEKIGSDNNIEDKYAKKEEQEISNHSPKNENSDRYNGNDETTKNDAEQKHSKDGKEVETTTKDIKKETPELSEYKLNENVLFYRNQLHSKPFPGAKIEDMLTWKGDYQKLERTHSYIQWLFPIPESRGMNYSAQPLQEHEAQIISDDEELRGKVLEAFRMMLDFYGMELDLKEEKISRADNWKERYEHLNRSTHNHFRITRIIKSLGELGWKNLQVPWIQFMMTETIMNKLLPKFTEQTMSHFIDAIKEEEEKWNQYAFMSDLNSHARDQDKVRESTKHQEQVKTSDIAEETNVIKENRGTSDTNDIKLDPKGDKVSYSKGHVETAKSDKIEDGNGTSTNPGTASTDNTNIASNVKTKETGKFEDDAERQKDRDNSKETHMKEKDKNDEENEKEFFDKVYKNDITERKQGTSEDGLVDTIDIENEASSKPGTDISIDTDIADNFKPKELYTSEDCSKDDKRNVCGKETDMKENNKVREENKTGNDNDDKKKHGNICQIKNEKTDSEDGNKTNKKENVGNLENDTDDFNKAGVENVYVTDSNDETYFETHAEELKDVNKDNHDLEKMNSPKEKKTSTTAETGQLDGQGKLEQKQDVEKSDDRKGKQKTGQRSKDLRKQGVQRGDTKKGKQQKNDQNGDQQEKSGLTQKDQDYDPGKNTGVQYVTSV